MPQRVSQFLVSNKINSKGRDLRFTEWLIPEGKKLYVLGNAGTNPDNRDSAVHTENIMITKGDGDFLISDKMGKEILKSKRGWYYYCAGGIAVTAACLAIIFKILQLW